MRTDSKERRFLQSTLTEENPFQTTADAVSWLVSTGKTNGLVVEPIPFASLGEWFFQEPGGNLAHRSGKFFRVEGVRVRTNLSAVREWDQPIIHQPEIGILGIIAKEFDGQLYLLLQAKMEPGNPYGVQLVPTVQATRSNYTQVHQGARPRYVEYFLERGRSSVLVDQLQFEQGSTFLRKRNRNIVVEVTGDLAVEDGYRWFTLGQVKKLLRIPNLVSMDTRTVVSCIPLVARDWRGSGDRAPGATAWSGEGGASGGFRADVLASLTERGCSAHADDAVLGWLTDLKCRYELEVKPIGLNQVRCWSRGDFEMAHDGGSFFRVMAVSVAADSREVFTWNQPLIGSVERGLIAFLVKEIDGVLHFLVQGKVEPGNPDTVAVGPSVQCALGAERLSERGSWPPLVDTVLGAPSTGMRYSSTQSEEGGRFYRVENDYRIVQIESDRRLELPDHYLWVTLRQLHDLLRYGVVNVEARSLLSCLSLTQREE